MTIFLLFLSSILLLPCAVVLGMGGDIDQSELSLWKCLLR